MNRLWKKAVNLWKPQRQRLLRKQVCLPLLKRWLRKHSRRKKTDLEKAARIAREKQKQEGLNLKEKQEYRSKFETLADASAKQDDKAAAKPRYKKYDKYEEKEERP